MFKYRCYDIMWDTDGISIDDLPEEYTLETEEEYDEYLADALSDIFGWCVESFKYEVIK